MADHSLPPVQTVEQLRADAHAVALACDKYHANLVLIGQSFYTCFDSAGPILAKQRFQTLAPFFERRTYLVKEERTRRHTRVLVYQPSGMQEFLAQQPRFHATLISDSPELLLIEISPPGMTGMGIAQAIGIPYRAHF